MSDNLTLISPPIRDWIKGTAAMFADDVAVVVERANVTPEPTASAWVYPVAFKLVSASDNSIVLPYSGTIAAAAGDTSSAGTASVSDATPSVVLGSGTVNLIGDAAAWLDTETATLTLTYTNLRGGTDTDTFVVTFTA